MTDGPGDEGGGPSLETSEGASEQASERAGDAPSDEATSDEASDSFLKAVARAPDAGRTTLPASGQVLGGRYRVGARLGAGGFGTVFEAHDLEFDRTVALKVLRRSEGSSLWMFKHEFRALAGLRHNNLVRLHELRAEGDLWYFTMERVVGQDLLSYGRSLPPGSPLLGAVIEQVARGLLFLHQRGVVHRDVKPSNVLVTGEGRAVVLDFGLALGPEGGSDVAGTPRYMSPEQAAGRAGPASDWYALGVVLHEVLTGRAPFDREGARVLEAKRSRDASPLPEPLASEPLGQLCSGLLRRDAAERAGALDVFSTLGVATDEGPAETLFVGRAQERRGLVEAFEQSLGGAAVVQLRGASGVGKSALLARFTAALAALPEAPLWLASKCHEQEVLPFKALDGAVDALFRHLSALPRAQAEALLGAEGADLAGLFPVLTPFAHGVSTGASSPAERRRRAFEAARAVLLRLIERRPVVLVVDDAHWADLDSVALLLKLLRAPAPPGLLLVLAFRTEEAGRSEALGALLGALRSADHASLRHTALLVPPLPHGDALELALRLRPDEAERLVAEAGGLPLLLRELAREDAGGRSLDELLRARVQRLPPPAQRLMRLLAVAGALDARVLIEAAGLGAAGFDVVDLLVDQGLARHRPGLRPALEPHHDRLREALLSPLDAEQRREAHAELAQALALLHPDDESMALHLEGAGQHAAAAEHAIRAGAAALASLGFDRAAGLLRRALALLPPGDARRPEILERLGEALGATGRNAAAAEACLEAGSLASGLDAVRLRAAATEHLLTCGRLEDGLLQGRLSLEALGLRFPASTPEAVWSLGRRAVLARLRDLRFFARDEATLDPADLLRVDACANLAINFALADPLRSAYFRKLELHLALELGEPRRVMRALLHDVTILAARSRGAPSPDERRIVALATQLHENFPEETPFVEGAHALLANLHGDAEASLVHAERVDRALLNGRLAQRYTSMARFLLLRGLCNRGHWARFRALYPAFLDDARARDDTYMDALLRAPLAHVYALLDDRPDDAPEGIDDALAAMPGFRPSFLINRLVAAVEVPLYQGRGRDAWQACRREWPGGRSRLVLFVFRIFHIEILWARGRALLGALADAAHPVERWRLRSELRRTHARLATHGTPLSLALAACLRPALVPPKLASGALVAAEQAIEPLHLTPVLLALRWRRGLVAGDEPLCADALSACAAEGVKRPAAWLRMLLPGP
jgi:eukaryotic-like serine/threonine-protein kinase